MKIKEEGPFMPEKIKKTKEEWRKLLTPEQFRVMWEKGTEPPFENAYWDNREKGVYRCASCGLDLFSSDDKYDSKTGWPSFRQPVAAENVSTDTDTTLSAARTEVVCGRCGAHLGHVFGDGPKPAGLRYCMNSAALEFERTEKQT